MLCSSRLFVISQKNEIQQTKNILVIKLISCGIPVKFSMNCLIFKLCSFCAAWPPSLITSAGYALELTFAVIMPLLYNYKYVFTLLMAAGLLGARLSADGVGLAGGRNQKPSKAKSVVAPAEEPSSSKVRS